MTFFMVRKKQRDFGFPVIKFIVFENKIILKVTKLVYFFGFYGLNY